MSTRIFVLDDCRTCKTAIASSSLSYFGKHSFWLARNIEDGIEILTNNDLMDVWILDNDLGPNVEGYEFLKYMILFHPNLLPDYLVSCSSNWTMREKIESYFNDWNIAGRPRIKNNNVIQTFEHYMRDKAFLLTDG